MAESYTGEPNQETAPMPKHLISGCRRRRPALCPLWVGAEKSHNIGQTVPDPVTKKQIQECLTEPT